MIGIEMLAGCLNCARAETYGCILHPGYGMLLKPLGWGYCKVNVVVKEILGGYWRASQGRFVRIDNGYRAGITGFTEHCGYRKAGNRTPNNNRARHAHRD